ncbi:hypothetical protein EFK83_07200 [Lactococcus cremoris]|nr:hypothetical protein ML8_0852 [Lactococcus lactis subsp. lactis]MCT0446513.1 hypothetical protein [Lactococcus cremoris]MCT0451178.1 hypothetical protein [Lactococcus cremoris]MCT0454296.1 hypothetical protein [Lactococcus cremoris]MDU0407001.1 hypothetical protein [Lactococcus lactis]
MKIKVETKKQIVLKCKSVFVWADFITPILCSENGHFMDTLLFLLKFSKTFIFIVHKPVIYSMFIYTYLSKL